MKKIYFIIYRLTNVLFGMLNISMRVFLKSKNKDYELYNINHLYGNITFILRDTKRTDGFIFLSKIQMKELSKELG